MDENQNHTGRRGRRPLQNKANPAGIDAHGDPIRQTQKQREGEPLPYETTHGKCTV